MSNLNLDNNDLEEEILRESIVSAVGLNSAQLQVGIKGDPSLRETVIDRCRYKSAIDIIFDEIEPVFESMLLERGIFRLFIGFNNSEVRTCSIFDPLREEIHDAGELVSASYVNRHFPKISYQDKVKVMRQLYTALIASDLYKHMPTPWQNITRKRHEVWQPMSEHDARNTLQKLSVMRNLEEYYLRNFSISIVQSVIRLQFNCDGTQIVSARDFDRFFEVNLKP